MLHGSVEEEVDDGGSPVLEFPDRWGVDLKGKTREGKESSANAISTHSEVIRASHLLYKLSRVGK